MALSIWNMTGNVMTFWMTQYMAEEDPRKFYQGRKYDLRTTNKGP